MKHHTLHSPAPYTLLLEGLRDSSSHPSCIPSFPSAAVCGSSPRGRVEPTAAKSPVGQIFVHLSLKLGPVVVHLEMRQLMDDDVFDQFGCHMDEFKVVGDDSLAPVARPPQGLHPTDTKSDTLLTQEGLPSRLKFRNKFQKMRSLLG